ncbi:hypothetical protein ABZ636_03745 [Streptomyces sp. NPDC007251]|uniref:hypothetical protein n=1 Tax=Streptomyces sp. NPDC007251 TaxID=3154483 RepID=UPI0033D9E05D
MQNTSQPLDLDAIQARTEAATPGPWGTYHDGSELDYIDIAADLEETDTGFRCRRQIAMTVDEPIDNDPSHKEWTVEQDRQQIHADAAFIAHAPEDIAALLAEVHRLRAELARRVQCNDCGAVGEVFTGTDGLAYLDPSGQIGHRAARSAPAAG